MGNRKEHIALVQPVKSQQITNYEISAYALQNLPYSSTKMNYFSFPLKRSTSSDFLLFVRGI